MATHSNPFRRVLVAIDDSPMTSEVLRQAAALGGCVGAHLTVLHVARPAASSFDSPRRQAQAERTARVNGEGLLKRARGLLGDLAVDGEVQFGDPADVICLRALEIGADLVVIGSRGLGRLEQLVLGSVSGAVVQRAPCSVMVVRKPA